MKNIELKAAVSDFARVRRVIRTLGARRARRVLVQVDSYFEVPFGRLKLRRLKGGRGGELIFYVRSNARKPRASDYEKVPVASAARTLRRLRETFAPGACVRKRRELWLIGATRVHLDTVERLGRFLEIEVPIDQGAIQARAVMRRLVMALGIAPQDILAGSYSDLLAARAAGRKYPRRMV